MSKFKELTVQLEELQKQVKQKKEELTLEAHRIYWNEFDNDNREAVVLLTALSNMGLSWEGAAAATGSEVMKNTYQGSLSCQLMESPEGSLEEEADYWRKDLNKKDEEESLRGAEDIILMVLEKKPVESAA